MKYSLLPVVGSLFLKISEVASSTAAWTYYNSYPFCCPESPNYDPNWSTTECDDFSGCDYIGGFAAIGQKSLEYVQTHNLIAFYDASDAAGTDFLEKYGNKVIELTYGDITFNATIADTCGDHDCNGCCTANSIDGFLVDMEYYTVMRNFGTTDIVDGTISYHIFENSIGDDTVPVNCGWIGHCSGDPCDDHGDCDGTLSCGGGICGGEPDDDGEEPSCGWVGHCAGDACEVHGDCDGELACVDGFCGGEQESEDEDPTCHDGMMNGNEAGVDCGGESCGSCPGDACEEAGDCASEMCLCEARQGRRERKQLRRLNFMAGGPPDDIPVDTCTCA